MDTPSAPLTPDGPDLQDLFDRYATLRDTIQGLEAEREELGAVIKAALLDGQRVETDIYRATLKRSRRLEYPVARFREVFGDAATLEVASIDKRKAEALAARATWTRTPAGPRRSEGSREPRAGTEDRAVTADGTLEIVQGDIAAQTTHTDSVQSVIKMAPHHFSNSFPGTRPFLLLPVGSTVTS